MRVTSASSPTPGAGTGRAESAGMQTIEASDLERVCGGAGDQITLPPYHEEVMRPLSEKLFKNRVIVPRGVPSVENRPSGKPLHEQVEDVYNRATWWSQALNSFRGRGPGSPSRPPSAPWNH